VSRFPHRLSETREEALTPQGTDPPRLDRVALLSRWDTRTVGRATVAGIWIALTSLWGLGFLYRVSFSASIGWEIGVRDAARSSLVAAGLFAAGPFGVWILRRRWPWLVLAMLIVAGGLLLSIFYFIRSASAPMPS